MTSLHSLRGTVVLAGLVPAKTTSSVTRNKTWIRGSSPRKTKLRCFPESGARCHGCDYGRIISLPRAPSFLLLGKMALDGVGHGTLALGAEGFAIGAHPIHRLRAPGVALLEARQHVAGEELIRALGRLPTGPVVGEQQDAAKAAGLGPIVLQYPQRVVGGADGTAAALVDRLDARHADRGTAPRG